MNTVLTIVFLLPLFFSIILHEIAHGYTAFRLGDPTAKSLGRLTLNPIKHVSLVGSILIPGMLLLTHSPFLFGWAKPVPVDPRNFKSPVRGMALVAIAGPLTNFSIAVVFAILLRLVPNAGLTTEIFQMIIAMNLVLGMFNLVPVPPLDGSRILVAFLPKPLAKLYNKLERVGLIVVAILLALGLFSFVEIPIAWVFQKLVGTPLNLESP